LDTAQEGYVSRLLVYGGYSFLIVPVFEDQVSGVRREERRCRNSKPEHLTPG
jgi:hypothetical protein